MRSDFLHRRPSIRARERNESRSDACAQREPAGELHESVWLSMPVRRWCRSGSTALRPSITRSMLDKILVAQPVAEITIGVERGVNAELL